MKAESKGQAAEVLSGADVKADDIKKIVFACDAGMGSSAMGATKFRNRIKPLNLGITVTNTSVDNVPATQMSLYASTFYRTEQLRVRHRQD